jgi:hypothetical protein
MKKQSKEKTDRFTKKLPVPLTDDEVRHRGEELASKLAALDEIDAALKVAKQEAKAKKEPIAKRVTELKQQIRGRKEARLVECELVRDFDARCAETMRLDTGEVVDTRPLTPEEMQTQLAVVKGGKKPAVPGKPKK